MCRSSKYTSFLISIIGQHEYHKQCVVFQHNQFEQVLGSAQRHSTHTYSDTSIARARKTYVLDQIYEGYTIPECENEREIYQMWLSDKPNLHSGILLEASQEESKKDDIMYEKHNSEFLSAQDDAMYSSIFQENSNFYTANSTHTTPSHLVYNKATDDEYDEECRSAITSSQHGFDFSDAIISHQTHPQHSVIPTQYMLLPQSHNTELNWIFQQWDPFNVEEMGDNIIICEDTLL